MAKTTRRKAGLRRPYAVEEKSIAALQADMAAGKVTAEALVVAYLARIEAIDREGPALRSVIAVNPRALEDARRLDAERAAGQLRGPLHGIPVLVKDNIDTDDGTATTAGSLALKRNVTRRDAPCIARMKAAGAVVLGKANLSEWANIRCSRSISGWSGVGGLVKNPYALDRSASGSSSGTGAAIAASLASVGIGTETDGSIVSPSSYCGLVGFKPTLGLVSRTHVVPISHSQDTPGPMTRSVEDAAILLSGLAGGDPADPATAESDAHARDFAAGLKGASLKGKRLGVVGFAASLTPAIDAVFAEAVARLRAGGAEIVQIDEFRPPREIGPNEHQVMMSELKTGLNAYLATTPKAVKTRTLAALIAFNARTARETALFGQDTFEKAQATTGLDDPVYLKAREDSLRAAGPEGIDKLIGDNRLDALIAPTCGPASRIDVVAGDHGVGRSSTLPAIAGYPHLTVPMGEIGGLPLGLSFVGRAWDDQAILRLGYAYEQAANARRPPTYRASVEAGDGAQRAFAPGA